MNHIGCRKEIKFVKSLWARRGHVVKIWQKETEQWKKTKCFWRTGRHCGIVSSLMVRVHPRYRAHTGAHLPVMWCVSSTLEIKRSSTRWLICPIASYASINVVTLNSTRHTHTHTRSSAVSDVGRKNMGQWIFRVKKKNARWRTWLQLLLSGLLLLFFFLTLLFFFFLASADN